MKKKTVLLLFAFTCSAMASKNVAYIYGDVAEDGTIPSGTEAPYDQMLLTDSGNTGLSQFKTMVEAQGYTISQHYDQTTTLNSTFLNPFDVVIFGLHQKVWNPSEKSDLDDWLRAGGGILMYSDSAAGGKYNVAGITNQTGQTAVNNILSVYGMEVTIDQGGGTRAYIPPADSPNPVIWDQPIFEGEGVSPIAVDTNTDARVLTPLDSNYRISGNDSIYPLDTRGITISSPVWAVIAHAPVDDGNIFVIFDRQPMWNNGPGSDINEEDNKEVLRRIVRYLANDYGNSSDWINLTSTNSLELTYRQWSGGTGTNGLNYVAKNTLMAVQQLSSLISNDWKTVSNSVEQVSVVPETSETEFATVRILPDFGSHHYFRMAMIPYTNNASVSGVIAINCGGSAFTGNDGTQYLADTYFNGGHTDSFPGNAVGNTDDDLLYNYARSDFSSYNIPVTNGNYTVRLKLAETYWEDNNKRVFDITIEGNLLIDDLDLFATAPGKWVAYDLEFPIEVTDNQLNIAATASVNNALLNALVIIPD